tara:strand:- start:3812 stop:4792 length:981 start_codon:yes stop_codon:yes gene_type:complete
MDQNSNHMFHAYEFDGKGLGGELDEQAAIKKVKAKQLAWVHLDANMDYTRTWLREHVDYLDHIILDALLAEETRPRMTQFEDGLLVILRGVNLNEGMQPEDMISIRIWIDPHRIISVQRRPLKAIRDICDLLEKGMGPKNSGDFLVQLTTRLFQRMEPVISDLDDRTDVIEEEILEDPDIALRRDIVDIRKKAIVFRRYISPQKEVISYLRSADVTWIDTMHRRGLQESQDRVMRYVEDLDAVRERAQIVKDELANIMADRMNKNMYVLSIVAAIFLPLGFLTGLLGINVGGMPGADSDIAFWIVCAICVAFGVGLLAVFRRLNWV